MLSKYINNSLMEIGKIKYGIQEIMYPEDFMYMHYTKCKAVLEYSSILYLGLINMDEYHEYIDLLDIVYNEILE